MSKVIKASQYNPFIESPGAAAGADVSPDAQCRLVLDQAFQKAKQIVESAQNYRSEQLRDCAEHADRELRESQEQGYREGFAHGREEGEKSGMESGMRQGLSEGAKKAEAENRQCLNELGEMIQSVEKSKTEILSKFESDLKDLAVTIARAIVKKELETDPKTLHTIIQNAVDSYRNQAWVRIYVSGNTANLLTKADVSIAQELQAVSDRVKVVVTTGISDESCVIEMPDQVIDAGIDTQLRKIQSALEESGQTEMG
ncbi:hypothetical protein EQM14_13485 [Caproiciproducens sp. NJN-50]|uniref:FliH/SctL family protein n=1 Tax=Acutalibacteraceae TaxID=3082771 RepID=UPI000FFE0B74|nr:MULTISPECIES: FliH/SctL family protein [Acutalibacteraceae]QAT50691.1 hypothetical protein EQM14_13485 [Caproiciproducens sp. NJN-50]